LCRLANTRTRKGKRKGKTIVFVLGSRKKGMIFKEIIRFGKKYDNLNSE
jgi:hypothetical protein